MENFVQFQCYNPFRFGYIFFDTGDHLVDQIFINNNVRVKYFHDFVLEDVKYHILMCKIKKKDEKNFILSMEQLKNKMLLLGHTDYEGFCNLMSEYLVPERKSEIYGK